MLSVENVACHSGGKPLLEIDRLQLSSGETLAILGPNGAGKSTLIKAICGDRKHQGRICLHGRERELWPSDELARHLGVLPQSSQLTFPFLAEEVVALGLIPLKLSRCAADSQIERLMERCDCGHLRGRHFPTLSGGEKQRVQLARVLLQLSQAEYPPLLLLDEPTSAQDLGHQHQLLTLLNELADDGYGVISILHDLNHTLHYCQRCLVLEAGRKIYDGAPEEVLNPQNVYRVWHYRPAFGWLQDDRLVMA